MNIKYKRHWCELLLILGALLGALGWWLPWVVPDPVLLYPKGSAALVLLGLDFSDFWKFTNEWRIMGLFWLERLCFVLPPPLVAMSLALWLSQKRWLVRGSWLPFLFFLSVVILPAFEDVRVVFEGIPLVYDDPTKAREFSFQLYFALTTLGVVALIPWWSRILTRRQQYGAIAFLGALGTLLPAWALWRTWLILQGFYGGNATLAPGILLSASGFLLMTCAALMLAVLDKSQMGTHPARVEPAAPV